MRILLTLLIVASFYCQAGANCVTLTWTASGDDNNAGTATRYDLRYSKEFISSSNWDLAKPVTLVTSPRPAGSIESLKICGLEYGTTFYFAIKVGDESGNWSNISNIAFATTPSRPTDRGDVNLNGVVFESGDIVVFMNYFLQGLSAFIVDLQAQITQTDINNDGVTLTVSDLVDLISIVVGGTDPFTKPSLSVGSVRITIQQ